MKGAGRGISGAGRGAARGAGGHNIGRVERMEKSE